MIVSDIMTRDAVSVNPDARLEDAVRLMVDRKISGLPVVEKNGKVVGMITEGDLLRRAEIGTEGKEPGWFEMFFLPGTSAYDYTRTHARKVGMLMSADVISISPEAPLAEATKLMRSNGVKRLPVLDKGRLVGILARADLIKVLADALQPAVPRSDTEITTRLSAELAKQGWFPKAQVETVVENGAVEYRGAICDVRERNALYALAEVAGARKVTDKLVCVEPISGAMIDENQDRLGGPKYCD